MSDSDKRVSATRAMQDYMADLLSPTMGFDVADESSAPAQPVTKPAKKPATAALQSGVSKAATQTKLAAQTRLAAPSAKAAASPSTTQSKPAAANTAVTPSEPATPHQLSRASAPPTQASHAQAVRARVLETRRKMAESAPLAERDRIESLKRALNTLPTLAEPIVDAATVVETETVAKTQPVVETPVVEPTVEQPPATPDTETPEPKEDTPAELEPMKVKAGQPDWAGSRFDCLLFEVAGLKLAVPLVTLGAIHRMSDELTPLFGKAAWFMGLLPVGDNNIRTVDTARWVMPERYQESCQDNYQFVISIDGCDWGLACDKVEQSFTLTPDEVKWRSSRSKRPWLAGTVVDRMCALLDVDTLSQMLERGMDMQTEL